jgi:hypothetical protein
MHRLRELAGALASRLREERQFGRDFRACWNGYRNRRLTAVDLLAGLTNEEIDRLERGSGRDAGGR